MSSTFTGTSGPSRTQPALPFSLRTPLLLAGLIGLVVTLALGIAFADTGSGSTVDRAVDQALQLDPGRHSTAYSVAWVVQSLADPIPAAVFVALLVGVCLKLRRRRLAVLAFVGPAAADSIGLITKHLVGRTIHGSLSYPSTHATQTVCFAIVVALLVCALIGSPPSASIALISVAAIGGQLVMGWALVATDVHWMTDTVGGSCLAVAVTFGVASAIDHGAEGLTKRTLR